MNKVNFRSERDIDRAIPGVRAHLAAGGLLAHPTETVYGIGCRAQPEALSALAGLKRRDSGKPFLILVASLEMAQDWGIVFDAGAARLAKEFWPGPLTLVLRVTGDKLPGSLKGPTGGIAVRCTSLTSMKRLIAALGYPITSTSANRPGAPPAVDVAAIENSFDPDPRLLALDGGSLPAAQPSTLVDCTGGSPQIIREGAVSRADIQSRAGSLVS